jgi:hypothetical protein
MSSRQKIRCDLADKDIAVNATTGTPGLAKKEQKGEINLMQHKSAFSRTLAYFQEADYREAKACHDAAYAVLAERAEKSEALPDPKPRRTRRTRKPRVNGTEAESGYREANS